MTALNLNQERADFEAVYAGRCNFDWDGQAQTYAGRNTAARFDGWCEARRAALAQSPAPLQKWDVVDIVKRPGGGLYYDAKEVDALLAQSPAPLPKWIDDMKGADPTLDGVIEYFEGRAQSPVSATAMRQIPDSECAQGHCGATTTGCWGECSLKMGWGVTLPATVTIGAPVSVEGLERDAARYRAIFDSQFSRLAAVKFREFDDPIVYTKQMADNHLDEAIAADKGTTS